MGERAFKFSLSHFLYRYNIRIIFVFAVCDRGLADVLALTAGGFVRTTIINIRRFIGFKTNGSKGIV